MLTIVAVVEITDSSHLLSPDYDVAARMHDLHVLAFTPNTCHSLQHSTEDKGWM